MSAFVDPATLPTETQLATVHYLPVPKRRQSRLSQLPAELLPCEPETFFDTVPLRRSAFRYRTALRGHSRRLGVDMFTLRSQLFALACSGLVTRKSLGNASDTIELTTLGVDSLTWSAPPCSGDAKRWAGEVARGIASAAFVSVHAMLFGRAKLARARLCHALLSSGWSPGRVQMQFGIPSAEVESAASAWVEHVWA